MALSDDRDNLTWFVIDVNAPQRLITAATVVFDQPWQRTVSFDLVQPVDIAREDEADAARAMRIIDWRLSAAALDPTSDRSI